MISRTSPVSTEQAAKLSQFMKISTLWSPIMRASWLGLEPVVQVLLEKGADLDDRLLTGLSAERLATDRGFSKIAQRLAQALAAPGETIHLRRGAFCATAEMGLDQMARSLGSNNAESARQLSRDGGTLVNKG
jgi:ankyrin repeat protein